MEILVYVLTPIILKLINPRLSLDCVTAFACLAWLGFQNLRVGVFH